jgi:hypothetical protein
MRKVDICDRNLRESFDWSDEEAHNEATSDPLAIALDIGTGITVSVYDSNKWRPMAYLHMLVPIAPSTEIRYAGRLPYLRAKGCQNNSPQPSSRNIYPVPSLSVDTETPEFSESGTSTE